MKSPVVCNTRQEVFDLLIREGWKHDVVTDVMRPPSPDGVPLGCELLDDLVGRPAFVGPEPGVVMFYFEIGSATLGTPGGAP